MANCPILAAGAMAERNYQRSCWTALDEPPPLTDDVDEPVSPSTRAQVRAQVAKCHSAFQAAIRAKPHLLLPQRAAPAPAWKPMPKCKAESSRIAEAAAAATAKAEAAEAAAAAAAATAAAAAAAAAAAVAAAAAAAAAAAEAAEASAEAQNLHTAVSALHRQQSLLCPLQTAWAGV